MNKTKMTIRSCFICTIVFCLLIIFFGNLNNKTYIYSYHGFDEFMYNFEEYSIKNNQLSIMGFCFFNNILYPDNSFCYEDADIIIVDYWNNSYQYRSTNIDYISRHDVKKLYASNEAFDKYGFKVIFNIKPLKKSILYNFWIVDKGNNIAYPTSIYLQNNKLYNYNPNTCLMPDLSKTDLKFLVEDNYVCSTYDSVLKTYLYIFYKEDKIYYFLDKKCYKKRNNILVQFEAPTNDKDEYINEDFYFESNDITSTINCGNYEVAVKNVSSLRKKSVYSIWTGLWFYDEGNSCCSFRFPISTLKGK